MYQVQFYHYLTSLYIYLHLMDPKANFIKVKRTARYYSLGADGAAVKKIYIALHGYGYHGYWFCKRFEPIDDGSTLVICPEGLSKFYKDGGYNGKVGSSWMTKENRKEEIEDYISYLNRLYDEIFSVYDRSSVDLVGLGFSQGGATLCRWLNNRHAHVDQFVLWCSSIPHDFDFEKDGDLFRQQPCYLYAGKKDPFLKWIEGDQYKNVISKQKEIFTEVWFDGEHEIRPKELLAFHKL